LFIHNESKARGKIWTASVDAANVKNPLAGNPETPKYAEKYNPFTCVAKNH
jgi:hypothetical protein